MDPALLVSLLLLAVPSIATDVYYVTPNNAAGHEQSCPPHQICHNLSYYISQPQYFFTSNTNIIFLEGEHSFDRADHVNVSNVHNLILKGQGQWPVAGAEETVMQSTVIINCTRRRGGFYFDTSHNITVEGLTVVNCRNMKGVFRAVFRFNAVHNIFFLKNSIQHFIGYGLLAVESDYVTVTNCSYYHSLFCYVSSPSGSGIGIVYPLYRGNKTQSYTISYSNFTKCCIDATEVGGGMEILVISAKVVLSHLIFSQNYGKSIFGRISGEVDLLISDCVFSYGFFGGVAMSIGGKLILTIQNTFFEENNIRRSIFFASELDLQCAADSSASLTLLIQNSTIVHTSTPDSPISIFTMKQSAVSIEGCFNSDVKFVNTTMTFANLTTGVTVKNNQCSYAHLTIEHCWFDGSRNVNLLLYSYQVNTSIVNSTFSNNIGGNSVISMYGSSNVVENSYIVDNNMTGLTLCSSTVMFVGYNVIQNNSNIDGAGITLLYESDIVVDGDLLLCNNTASRHGGGIFLFKSIALSEFCTVSFYANSNSRLTFQGNRAGKGGSDTYGLQLMYCYSRDIVYRGPILPVGNPNEISYYMDTPLMKYFHFSNTDKLSSMSSDPIMVCFCNKGDLPDCSDRTQHLIQTYPGLEINTSIATVGYYGGTSPGNVQVTAQNATLVQYHGQNLTTNCFQLHILLQNTSSTTALVDIRVDGGLHDWGVSIGVEILECPIGFTEVSGQCQCEHNLQNSNVQCDLSNAPFKFQRSGNSWFGYINKTRCVTGTTSCPFDYCNRSNVSFDIMAPDHQCMANRTGILCGQCLFHLSIMLGSNHCGTCSNWYLFLLPVFALAGIVLVAVLMFLNLSVSVGTINGLLFYANMVKLNEAFFFPNGSIPVVSQFISWLNLDLGIEVCLFNGLDGYWNTWLQFVFPTYLFLLMGGIIVGCRYSVWLCRLCGSHAVPALATLFLMSYTKILLTVTNALFMSLLPCNDSILTVWSVDGNIVYGSGKHLIVVIFSCGVLVIGLVYPFLVMCAPLLERYSHKCIPCHRLNPVAKFKPLLDAYGGPYKDKYRFWTGVTLMVRLVATVTFSFTSGGLAVINASIITTVVVGILTFWSFTKGVYKKIYLNTLEAFYLLNIFFLSYINLFLRPSDCQIATTISVCMSFFVSLGIVTMHLWWNFDLKKIKRRLGCKDRPEYIEVPQVSDENDEEDRSPIFSRPAIVYSSRRGEHQFELEFPHLDEETSSPVLLAREPLLFDT